MGFAEGVVWSLLGAVAHTAIDVLRKFAAQRLPPADLIALLTIYNATFAIMGVWMIDGGLPVMEDMPNLALFFKSVVLTACTGLVAAVLYQRALAIAPLSLTVPYLAFAPVFVVLVSPMFLVGEVPTAMGLAGVAVVSLAGYKLGVLGAADTAALSQQAVKAGKSKLPLLPVGSHALGRSSSTSRLSQPELQCSPEAQQLLTADAQECRDDVYYGQPQPQQSRVYQRQPAQLALPEANGADPQSANGVWQEPRQQSRADEQLKQQQRGQPSDAGSMCSSSSAGGAKQQSAWAIAYYKQKSPQVGVWEAACGGLQSAAQQLLATAGMSPRSRAADSAENVFGVGSMDGHHQPTGFNGSGSGSAVGSLDSRSNSAGGAQVWVDSQAKAGKDIKHTDSKRGAHGSLTAAPRSTPPRRWPLWIRLPLRRLQQAVQGPAKLLSGPTAGPTLVLIVAFLYSLTASFDKLGMSSSSSTAFYIMMQRVLIAVMGLIYLLAASPRTLRHLYRDAVLLVTLSLAEQLAIVLYFKAIQNILVSYMVAIKRINVLLSTLVGCVMFQEKIGRRMPYILLMLLGMLLIVLQPGHEALHHSHHTHRLR